MIYRQNNRSGVIPHLNGRVVGFGRTNGLAEFDDILQLPYSEARNAYKKHYLNDWYRQGPNLSDMAGKTGLKRSNLAKKMSSDKGKTDDL
jgi:hypothetical protein